MNVCVAGLWHLGSVVAACLAEAGHSVVGYDDSIDTVASLADGRAPVVEAGLDELLRRSLAAGRLRFTAEPADALRSVDVLWVTWDTPVDDDDRADVVAVTSRVEALVSCLAPGTMVIVSSQLPVGTTALLERYAAARRPGFDIAFACVPENLRLGRAIETFVRPDRIVAGIRTERDRARIAELLAPITTRIEWMSVESAELTKHAINAFLATSVAFANEIATIAERVGADAGEVARGLKSDVRIGSRAYLSPGAAFSGGTLARDIVFLTERGAEKGLMLRLIPSVRESNAAHGDWAVRRLESTLGEVRGRTVAVWGLTYKPGTDTLRRSGSVALCRTLAARGATMRVFDPVVHDLPSQLAAVATLAKSPTDAARGASALVVATEWPIFLDVTADEVVAAGAPIVFDPGRFLATTLGSDARLRYVTVGSAAA